MEVLTDGILLQKSFNSEKKKTWHFTAGKDIKGLKTVILFFFYKDITHPIPDLTGYITEGQIYVDRQLHNRQVGTQWLEHI